MSNILKIITIACQALNLYEAGDDVVQINGKEEFDKFIADYPIALVEFYAPWCGHCKTLAPEFKKAATTLKNDNIGLAAVDATLDANKELSTEYGVSGFPTLKIFNNKYGSGVSDYNGGRTESTIIESMLKENKPLISEIKDISEVTGDKPNFVQVGEITEAVKNIASAKKAHMAFQNITESTSLTAGKLQVIEGSNAVEQESDDIDAFVSKQAYPVVGQLTPENYQFYMDRGLDMLWFGLKSDDTASVEAIKQGVQDQAGKYSFVWLDHEKFEGFLKQNMGCEEINCGVLVKDQIKQRFSDNGLSLNAADIKKFLEDDKDGKLKNWFKSQEIPSEAEENNVTVLVGKNFEEVVKGNNVFVFFYAPWCGHCKSSKPEQEKLKDELAREDIILAKFDSTENDVPHPKVTIEGFPSFYLFKAGDQENPIVFNGGRQIADWKNWLLEQLPADNKTDL